MHHEQISLMSVCFKDASLAYDRRSILQSIASLNFLVTYSNCNKHIVSLNKRQAKNIFTYIDIKVLINNELLLLLDQT